MNNGNHHESSQNQNSTLNEQTRMRRFQFPERSNLVNSWKEAQSQIQRFPAASCNPAQTNTQSNQVRIPSHPNASFAETP